MQRGTISGSSNSLSTVAPVVLNPDWLSNMESTRLMRISGACNVPLNQNADQVGNQPEEFAEETIVHSIIPSFHHSNIPPFPLEPVSRLSVAPYPPAPLG